ncbi:PucR family transcriptional regulator [Microbacterium resistens]|uniref:PucR family transcriptional regulator n=1 Tax=Microbacterium resistens TaxID=156977 RepID=UPI00366DAD9B
MLTVAEALTVGSLRDAHPEVLAGDLDVPVRWVHVSDSDRVAALLDGGELLLTTGAGWAGTDAALAGLVHALADADLAGIVLELGTRFAVAPPALVAACRERDLALVALEREVKFVAVTEDVHRRIIAGQVEALEERQRLHDLFTGLSLRGAAVEVVVRETARALRAPVVLEDLAHEVVVADAFDLPDAEALAGWTERSRRRDAAWTRVPVAARGTHWGELVALPGPPHPAGRATVLEQAATTLALSRLSDPSDAWARLRGDLLLGALLAERFVVTADIETRLAASGFPVAGRSLFAVVQGSGAVSSVGAASDAGAAAGAGSVAGAGARGSGPGGAASAAFLPRGDADVAFVPGVDATASERTSAPGAAEAWAPGALATRFGPSASTLSGQVGSERVLLVSAPRGQSLSDRMLAGLGSVAVSEPASSVDELRTALSLVRRLARRAAPGEVLRAGDRPLARLAAELGGDDRLRAHSARMLGPLIRHDEASGGDLLRVLAAVVAHPANRTAAAAASHLSRSVFYQRLALIGDLLGADLDDGETLAALHLALLAHGG